MKDQLVMVSTTRTRTRLLLGLLALAVSLLVTLAGWPATAPVQAQEEEPTESPTASPEEGTLTWSVRPTPTDEEPERPNFSLDVEGGDTLEDSIRVRNFGEEPLALEIYASDAITTSSGALDLLPAGEEPSDVGAWIELAGNDIEVPPGEAVDVPFTMTVPENAEPGDHTGGIVTSFQSASEDDEGEAVVLDRRLGNRVQVRVGGELRPALEVQDLAVAYEGTFNPFSPGTVTVTYTVTNTGNVRLGADQQVVVPGRFGVPGRVAEIDSMPELLPDNSLEFAAEVDSVWPTFQTTVRVELEPTPVREGDAFDVEPTIASATTSSIPWGQLAILLVVILLVAWVWWSRRRRTRREEAIRAEARAEAAGPTATTPDGPASDTSTPDPGPGSGPGDEPPSA